MAEERIAKIIARSGIASRRGAEQLVRAGRVAVNGRTLDSPAFNAAVTDSITVDGRELPERESTRLWRLHKPVGIVTTSRDDRGRRTVADILPNELPKVMPVGRLDINSEGLLLLTNDGELKRRLELPRNGWIRKYRARVHGIVTDSALQELRNGITVNGELLGPIYGTLDHQLATNAWLTVGLRSGRNREVRRALEAVGLAVNRLIRISFGPFKLGTLKPGELSEIRPRTLRQQIDGLPEFKVSR